MPSWSESQDRLIKRRRRTTKYENAILEDLFQKVKIALCLVSRIRTCLLTSTYFLAEPQPIAGGQRESMCSCKLRYEEAPGMVAEQAVRECPLQSNRRKLLLTLFSIAKRKRKTPANGSQHTLLMATLWMYLATAVIP